MTESKTPEEQADEAEPVPRPPAPTPPIGAPVRSTARLPAPPPPRFTPQRLLIFFSILVGVAASYLLLSELLLAVWLRGAAQDLVRLAMNAEVDQIGRLTISRNGELVLYEPRVSIVEGRTRKLFFTAASIHFALEGDVQRFLDKGVEGYKDLRIRRVDLRRPHLYFRKDMEGEWNIDLAFRTKKERAPAPVSDEEVPDYFPREGIHIHDATVHAVFYNQAGDELDWEIENLQMKITKTPSGHLQLRDAKGGEIVEGDFYGGKITASLELLDYRDIVEGNIQIKVIDAQISRMTKNVDLQRRMAGDLSAFITLTRTRVETQGQLRGSGWIKIREGDLYDYPMVVGALSVLSFVAPGDNLITEAVANFTLEKDYIRIDQLDFIGRSLSLYGSGECGLNGENLYVVLAPKLPGIFNPLNLALGVMGTALLEGSVLEPKARYTPLSAIDPAVRRLIEETINKGG